MMSGEEADMIVGCKLLGLVKKEKEGGKGEWGGGCWEEQTSRAGKKSISMLSMTELLI